MAPEKWSPAQVIEHVRLAYDVVGRELAGGAGLKIRTPWWLRLVLRFRYLPAILSGGRIPEGARAAKEVRPGPGPFPRERLIESLIETASATEAVLWSRRGDRLQVTHHVFGKLSLDQMLRFATVHNQHHTLQLTTVSVS